MFPQLHISPNFHLIFLVVTAKIYPVLCFVMQSSEILIRGNGYPSLLPVPSGSV
jgi:hypothetical protein